MGVEKNINYEGIGVVRYKRNPRARNISIRISREGEVRVTVPGRCPVAAAEKFVHRKQDWIQQKVLEIERKKRENRTWKGGSVVDLLGNEIFIAEGSGPDFLVSRENRDYRIELPTGFEPGDATMQSRLIEIIKEIGRAEARERLPVLCASLAYCYGFEYTKVTIRSMRSRWGSCSVKNNISLNSALIFLNRDLVEYVILHELVHTLHKHHGQDFWTALEKVVPDAKARRRRLRGEEILI